MYKRFDPDLEIATYEPLGGASVEKRRIRNTVNGSDWLSVQREKFDASEAWTPQVLDFSISFGLCRRSPASREMAALHMCFMLGYPEWRKKHCSVSRTNEGVVTRTNYCPLCRRNTQLASLARHLVSECPDVDRYARRPTYRSADGEGVIQLNEGHVQACEMA